MEWYDLIFRTIADNVGRDNASVLGLVVRVVCFPVTMWRVSHTNATAEAAKQAVDQVKKDLACFDAMTELSAATVALDEIKDLQRAGAWQHLPRRYSAIRRSIVEIRTVFPNLSRKDPSILNGVIQHLKIMEGELDKNRFREGRRDIARLNRTVSDMQDRLNELIAEIKSQVGK